MAMVRVPTLVPAMVSVGMDVALAVVLRAAALASVMSRATPQEPLATPRSSAMVVVALLVDFSAAITPSSPPNSWSA